MNKEIRLILITGFLGSGKTSVINSLLTQLKETSVGLILNDFGSIAVDTALVEGSESVVKTTSLSGGQIFCSCLSGSFISSVEAMAQMAPEVIIVEASGLAKPAPLLEIISVIQKRTENRVTYGGMLCVVDAERYTMLSQSLKTLEEQIVFSDWFILNKTDLVDSVTLSSVRDRVQSLRPLSPVFPTTYGKVSSDLLDLLMVSTPDASLLPTRTEEYRGWGVNGRPKTSIFEPQGTFTYQMLEDFVTQVSSHLLRMKGFLPTSSPDKAFLIDAVGPHVSLTEVTMPPSAARGVVCIYGGSQDPVELLQRQWTAVSGSDTPAVRSN